MSKDNEISSAEILHRNFSTSMFGYKKVEVETFLEKIDEEQKEREDLISKTLLIAEKTREDLIKNAQKEAETIVKEADLKGKKMLAEAKNLVSVLEYQTFYLEEQKRIFLMKFKTEMEAMLKKINEDELLDKARLEKAKSTSQSETRVTEQSNDQSEKRTDKDKE